jgi:hypothetical protein
MGLNGFDEGELRWHPSKKNMWLTALEDFATAPCFEVQGAALSSSSYVSE